MKDISDRIKEIRAYTPKVGVFGNSGVGKSSLCNSLFGKDIAKISDVEACTRKPQEILIGADGDNGGITLVDVPGIGEDPAHQKEYTALYKSLVPELDLVLWAIKGYCAQFTDKFHENYFSYIIHIDSGLESNVSAYHRRSVPSSHAFASTLQLHKLASRCMSDSS